MEIRTRNAQECVQCMEAAVFQSLWSPNLGPGPDSNNTAAIWLPSIQKRALQTGRESKDLPLTTSGSSSSSWFGGCLTLNFHAIPIFSERKVSYFWVPCAAAESALEQMNFGQSTNPTHPGLVYSFSCSFQIFIFQESKLSSCTTVNYKSCLHS